MKFDFSVMGPSLRKRGKRKSRQAFTIVKKMEGLNSKIMPLAGLSLPNVILQTERTGIKSGDTLEYAWSNQEEGVLYLVINPIQNEMDSFKVKVRESTKFISGKISETLLQHLDNKRGLIIETIKGEKVKSSIYVDVEFVFREESQVVFKIIPVLSV